APPATSRTGLPHVWPSIQKKVCLAIDIQSLTRSCDRWAGSEFVQRRACVKRRADDRLGPLATRTCQRHAWHADTVVGAYGDRFRELDVLYEMGRNIEV